MKRKRGFFCRACGRRLPTAYSRDYPTTGMKVRYFRCPCGCRFKSQERLKETPPK